ncbi:protein disulfide-isomerase precursor [Puccinia graminis f. sp. tritici]|uniref:protein disulfide-isomerase n=1 Tax=Puccinia graminis f. sp. tritici TaxID=56615 RepID=A0A5B0M0E6_PUCGR|nr:protein disulfide-isomerase precursor [Puccinia graminis f. sp. tritici]
MRSFRILSALLALASSIHADAGVDPNEAPDDVIELTSENFATVVTPAPLILVEFMAPWCGHCKALMPEYKRAATLLKKEGIPVAKADCTEQSELCAKHEIQGYPTLKIFSNGVASEYKGPRKAEGIVSYMEKRAHPVVTLITSHNHTEFTQSGNVVVIAYLDHSDKDGLAAFTRFAESKRDDYVFGVCYDHSSIKDVSSLPQGSLVLWKKFDEGRNDFTGEKLTEENIAKFVNTNSVPLFDELTPSNFALYSEIGLPLAYTFIEANNPKRESLIKSLESVAKDNKGHLNFVWIDATKFGDYAKSLNLPGTDWPEFVIQDLSNQDKYPLEAKKEVNHDHVAEFVKSYRAGKLEKSVKSQPIPKQGDGTYVLVAKAFEDVVYANNNQKDVFLEFYAPWCGHCKRLKPIWDNLARSFTGSSDKVLIANFDATENDIPSTTGISVQGYPTLKFKPAGSKEWIDYDDERELDAMIAFVEKNSVNKVKAVKVELPEPVEGGDGADQVVFDSEETEPAPEDEDNDAEHDEL